MTRGSGQPRPRLEMGGGPGGRSGEEATDARSTVARLLRYLAPYRASLVAVTALVVATTLLNLLGPILFGRAIDRYLQRVAH